MIVSINIHAPNTLINRRSASREELPKKEPRAAARKQYLCTLNNYTDEEVEKVQKFAKKHCQYLVYGKEIAPTTGTPHLQIYLYLLKKNRGTFIHKAIPRMAVMMNKVYGSAAENRDYCLKTRPKDIRKGTPANTETWSHGECPLHVKGERPTLLEACDLVKARGLRAIMEDDELIGQLARYQGGLTKIAYMSQKTRSTKTHVTVIVGSTGTGKSTLAGRWPHTASVNPPKSGAQLWFDPYDYHTHETIWIDDYKSSSCYQFSDLLKLLDRNPMTLPVKNGWMEMGAKYIVITSSQKPSDWYHKLFTKHPGEYAQLDRRIDVCITVESLGDYRFKRGSVEDLPPGVTLPEVREMAPPPPLLDWSDPAPIRSVNEVLMPRPGHLGLAPFTKPPKALNMTPAERHLYNERRAKFREDMLAQLKKVPN